MAARDVLFMAVILFAVGLGFFVFHYVMNNVVEEMIGVEAINQSSTTVDVLTATGELTNRLDYVVFGIFIGFLLGIIISGWFVGGNPIFMFIYFLVVTMAVIIGAVLANVWEEVTAQVIFGTTIAHFPITNNLLLNSPLYVAVIGIVGMIVMFGKPYMEQQ